MACDSAAVLDHLDRAPDAAVVQCHDQEISGRDLILIGAACSCWPGDYEIHDRLEGDPGHSSAKVAASFASVIAQVMLLDIVFSLDSVITAIGMAMICVSWWPRSSSRCW